MKIRTRITLFMVALNIVSIGLIGSILITRSYNTVDTFGELFATASALHKADTFTDYLLDYVGITEEIAAVIGGFESIPAAGRRAFLNNTVNTLLSLDEDIVSVWNIWNPNVLEGNDQAWIGAPGTNEAGRFVPRYVRNRAGNIVPAIMANFDNDEVYLTPRRTGRTAFTNPRTILLGGEMREVISISAPIHNTAGQIVGVMGLDVSITTLQEIGQEIDRYFPGTLTMAFANNGTVVSHFDTGRLNRSMRQTETDTFGTYLSAVEEAIQRGDEFSFSSVVNGRTYMFDIVPVEIAPGIAPWSFVIGIPRDELHEETRAMIIFAIGICLFMLVLVIVVAMFVSGAIAKPIVNMANTLKNIARGDGDLTVTLPITGGGEIEETATYFNETMKKIRELVVTIKAQADRLNGIGNDLASNMTETASAMNEITANIQSIKGRVINQSASVTETNATMEQVTSNINKLNNHVERQTSAVSQTSSAIEEMLANIQSVTTTLVKNAANVKELQGSSEVGRTSLLGVVADIQEILKESESLLEINSVMNNIASQTNLLSMNAAIEAAHAGEAGRGFAVVADEIRKLAESSGTQSKTINSVLKKIKSSIDKISHSTGNVLSKFEVIDQGIRTVAEQEEVIRNAMEEQSQGSRQILNASAQVNEITQQVKSGSMEMLDGSKEVIHESKNLEMVTQEITNGMNEMASGADQINTAVNSVNEISTKNRENISILVQAISKFKV